MATVNLTCSRRRLPVELRVTFFAVIGVLLCIAISTSGVPFRTTIRPSIWDNTTSRQKPRTDKSSNTDKKYTNKDICLTPGCINAASSVLKNMDPNVAPCDDFYQFACGGYLNSTIIPDDQVRVDSFTNYDDKVTQQLRMSYEAIPSVNQTRHFTLLRNLYHSCMNTSKIEADGLVTLQNILKKLGGWPVLDGDTWAEKDFDWIKLNSKLRYAGYSDSWVLQFGINTDMKNTTRRVIYIDQPGLGLTYDYLMNGFNDTIVQAYYSYMTDIAVLLGANKDRARQELRESLQFEMNLANISLADADRRDNKKLYNPTTLGQLVKKFPSIAWKEWFTAVLPSTIILTENEPVIVAVPSYIIELEKLIATTPKRTLANYIYWRAVQNSVFYLNKQMRKRSFDFSATIIGVSERKPRWKECVSEVTNSLSISAASLYVKNYFNEKAKTNAVVMTKNIKTAFKKMLEAVDWMDDATKESALEKADKMNPHVAYPDEVLNDTEVNAFYQSIELTGGNFLESALNVSLLSTLKEYSSLRLPVDRDEWTIYGNAAVVNAFYRPLENTIDFPAGILQGTFFSSDRPWYMNYGGIGSVIGHEITHGFDDSGRQFDETGNLVDWWKPATKENFVKRAQCIVDQYSNYTVKSIGKNVNGVTTQGENIADNGGVREAYLAYEAWVAANKQEHKLPGLPYTPQQMFWISMANLWCTKITSKAQENFLITDPHSPGEFRVIGPLSNSAEFSKDFNCSVGSKMNPIKKCVVW